VSAGQEFLTNTNQREQGKLRFRKLSNVLNYVSVIEFPELETPVHKFVINLVVQKRSRNRDVPVTAIEIGRSDERRRDLR